MKIYQFFSCFLFMILFASCSELDQTLLHGNWKGDRLTADGEILDRGVEDVAFQFNADGTYTYQTAIYKEAGRYRTLENKLYTTDTLAEQRLEKVVRITQLTSDSLLIQMNNGGKKEMLSCVKVK